MKLVALFENAKPRIVSSALDEEAKQTNLIVLPEITEAELREFSDLLIRLRYRHDLAQLQLKPQQT
jgi:hypothetical protein